MGSEFVYICVFVRKINIYLIPSVGKWKQTFFSAMRSAIVWGTPPISASPCHRWWWRPTLIKREINLPDQYQRRLLNWDLVLPFRVWINPRPNADCLCAHFWLRNLPCIIQKWTCFMTGSTSPTWSVVSQQARHDFSRTFKLATCLGPSGEEIKPTCVWWPYSVQVVSPHVLFDYMSRTVSTCWVQVQWTFRTTGKIQILGSKTLVLCIFYTTRGAERRSSLVIALILEMWILIFEQGWTGLDMAQVKMINNSIN
jgi:hypothetical protein